MLFEGYFDESGSLDEAPGVFGMAGYFIEPSQAKVLDLMWGKILERHNLPYFHMVDCAHGAGVFAGKTKEERAEIASLMIGQIKLYTLCGVSVLMMRSGRQDYSTKEAYADSVKQSIIGIEAILFSRGMLDEDHVSYFFETGHAGRGDAYRALPGALLMQPRASVTFAKKEELRLLQAADLLAWQTTKYAKDLAFKISVSSINENIYVWQANALRPPRKDFLSLMEHHHDIWFLSHNDQGKLIMTFQLWPKDRADMRWRLNAYARPLT